MRLLAATLGARGTTTMVPLAVDDVLHFIDGAAIEILQFGPRNAQCVLVSESIALVDSSRAHRLQGEDESLRITWPSASDELS